MQETPEGLHFSNWGNMSLCERSVTTRWNGRWEVFDPQKVEQGILDIKDRSETVAWGHTQDATFIKIPIHRVGLVENVCTSMEVYIWLEL